MQSNVSDPETKRKIIGGLPERINLKLVEPLRELFKAEVRVLGHELGLPDAFIARHPFLVQLWPFACRVRSHRLRTSLSYARSRDQVLLSTSGDSGDAADRPIVASVGCNDNVNDDCGNRGQPKISVHDVCGERTGVFGTGAASYGANADANSA